jgi:hypothetical protein
MIAGWREFLGRPEEIVLGRTTLLPRLSTGEKLGLDRRGLRRAGARSHGAG